MSRASSARRPNVVLINCDDLGYGDLGCYGSTLNKTPTHRPSRRGGDPVRLVLHGVARVLAVARCDAHRLLPAADRVRVVRRPSGALSRPCHRPRRRRRSASRRCCRTPATARRWSASGTAATSPSSCPTNHGFDHYFGLPYSNDMGRQADTPSFFPEMPPLPLLDDAEVIEQQPDQASLTERYLTEAVRFMRSARDEPFFLYFAHMYVHTPIYVQQRFAEPVGQRRRTAQRWRRSTGRPRCCSTNWRRSGSTTTRS